MIKGQPDTMRVVFRVDASIRMGTGHVMRCLTLAEELRRQGAECSFICRAHSGHLIGRIQQSGFQVYSLEEGSIEDGSINAIKSTEAILASTANEENKLYHANWLATTQSQDAKDCLAIMQQLQPDWLVVDHYALDNTWQKWLQPYYDKLMVIDDLGDREHLADLLLDQNYGSTTDKYQHLVPAHCEVLVGTEFALLRDEFVQWRNYSLERRHSNSLIKNLLITLGGADPDNYTEQILHQLSYIDWPEQIEIIVVMGSTAPFLDSVIDKADAMPVHTIVKTNVSNMAELMSHADLAIGAAGSTTWERCCVGLPTIQVVIAENQRRIAEDLAQDNIIKLLYDVNELPEILKDRDAWMVPLANSAKLVTDGLGTKRVVDYMLKGHQS